MAEMIRNDQPVQDQDLLDTLGRDGTITVPLVHGRERLLPSGEILSVLADGTGRTMVEVLSSPPRPATSSASCSSPAKAHLIPSPIIPSSRSSPWTVSIGVGASPCAPAALLCYS